MARGGRVTPKPGTQYPNRSDLRKGPTQPIRTAPGQTYGLAQQQAQSQSQIPLSQTPSVAPEQVQSLPVPSVAPEGGGGGPQLPSLTAPTTRPNEPLTAGLSSGAGPGPEALGHPTDPTLATLKGAYSIFPTPGLLALIQEAQGK